MFWLTQLSQPPQVLNGHFLIVNLTNVYSFSFMSVMFLTFSFLPLFATKNCLPSAGVRQLCAIMTSYPPDDTLRLYTSYVGWLVQINLGQEV